MIYSSGCNKKITAKMREHLGWLENCSMILDTIFMENVIFTIHWILGLPRLPLFKAKSWWKTGSSIISSSFPHHFPIFPRHSLCFFGLLKTKKKTRPDTCPNAGRSFHSGRRLGSYRWRCSYRGSRICAWPPRARGQLRVASTGDSWTSWRIKCNVVNELNTVSYYWT